MKLAFITSILNLPTSANGAFKLLLFLSAFLTGTQDFALHELDEKTALNNCGEVENAEETVLVACAITSIMISNISNCNNNGTNDIAEDDFFHS